MHAAYVLFSIGLINIIWSTLFQEKTSWNEVIRMFNGRDGYQAFFIHTSKPGSVCWFGILSGILIILYSVIQFILVDKYLRNDDKTSLQSLLNASIGINVVILLLMFVMNSTFAHYGQGVGFRLGLFEHSLIYFICQFIAIGWLKVSIKR